MKRVSLMLSRDDEDAVALLVEAVTFLKGTLQRQQRGLTAEQGRTLDRMEEITQELQTAYTTKFTGPSTSRGKSATVPVLKL